MLYPVLGPLDPSELDVTLPHEHLAVDFSSRILKPEYLSDDLEELEVTMANLGKIRHFPWVKILY